MDKLIAFFRSKTVRAIAWGVLAICIVILAIGGTKAQEVSGFVETTVAGMAGVGAIVAYISGRVK